MQNSSNNSDKVKDISFLKKNMDSDEHLHPFKKANSVKRAALILIIHNFDLTIWGHKASVLSAGLEFCLIFENIFLRCICVWISADKNICSNFLFAKTTAQMFIKVIVIICWNSNTYYQNDRTYLSDNLSSYIYCFKLHLRKSTREFRETLVVWAVHSD